MTTSGTAKGELRLKFRPIVLRNKECKSHGNTIRLPVKQLETQAKRMFVAAVAAVGARSLIQLRGACCRYPMR